jgi:SAM domain (Sterile alpha motif)
MQQIADWLEKLGLSEYAQRFAENDIDFTILRPSPQGVACDCQSRNH